MHDEGWQTVDTYLDGLLIGEDPALDAALAANSAAALPPIDVTGLQGKMLHLVARVAGARRILEIGTLGGYSTIWLARALPDDGRLVSLELDAHHAEVARANVEHAGLSGRVEIRVGRAVDSLAALETEGQVFDLVFIDADKPSNPKYVEWALRLTRPGAVIVLDNVVRQGRVVDAAGDNADVVGTRAALEMIGADPRLDATALQTVGAKGWDGFVLAVVAPA